MRFLDPESTLAVRLRWLGLACSFLLMVVLSVWLALLTFASGYAVFTLPVVVMISLQLFAGALLIPLGLSLATLARIGDALSRLGLARYAFLFLLPSLSIALVGLTVPALSFENATLTTYRASISPRIGAYRRICADTFEKYPDSIPGGFASTIQMPDGGEAAVSIDPSGDAIWFEIATYSLNSFGFVCSRPGVPPENAIWGYEERMRKHTIHHQIGDLYWWD